MIEGKRIRLRIWREGDLALLTSLRNDIALQAQLLARTRGNGTEQVLNWLRDRADRLLYVIADRSSDDALGYLQVAELDTVDCYADLGICLMREMQGRGLGGEAIGLICDYLRNTWHLRKVGLRLRADNSAALRCYEKAGFEQCGLLKKHTFLEGRWLDVILMERLLIGVED